jgi:hypothetical protein
MLPALVLLLTCHVSEGDGQMLTAGIKGGLTSSNMSGEDAGGFRSRTGVALGGFVVFGLGEVVAIQPEVLFTPKGGRADAVEGTGGVRLSYLDLPLLFNFTHPAFASPTLRPHLLLGPVVSLRLRCQVEADLGEEAALLDCDDPLLGGELATRSSDWGVLFGGGVQYGIGPVALVVDARYTLGLVSLDASPASQDVRNRVLSVLLGVGFRPGR